MILTGAAVPYAKNNTFHHGMRVYDDKFIPGLRRLAKAVHEADRGCRILLQVGHQGRQVTTAESAPNLGPYLPVAFVEYISAHPEVLAQDLNEAERRHLIAHALAHHLLHSGNQLSFHDWQKASLHKQEREAEECAAHILMPEEELAKLGNMPVWEIAEYFGVPEALARHRVTEFATDREMLRWQTPG